MLPARHGLEDVSAVIKCQQCHAEMDNGAVFCDFCGHELVGRPEPTRTTPRPSDQLPILEVAGAPQTSQRAGRLPAAIILKLGASQSFMLRGKSEYRIGRLGAGLKPPDVDLANWYGFEAGVSRKHAKIHMGPEGVFIKDVGSRSETIQNGFRLMPDQWYPLHDGDELRLGAIILRVVYHYDA